MQRQRYRPHLVYDSLTLVFGPVTQTAYRSRSLHRYPSLSLSLIDRSTLHAASSSPISRVFELFTVNVRFRDVVLSSLW